jgi:hypothetical protein
MHATKSDYTMKHADLKAQIKALYVYQDKLFPADRYMFNTSLENWNTQLLTQVQYWLKVHKPLIKYCAQLAKTQRKYQTSDIKPYLPKADSTTLPQDKSEQRKKHKQKKTQAAFSHTQDIRKFTHSTNKSTQYSNTKKKKIHTRITEYYCT